MHSKIHILISGATSGIGQAIAQEILKTKKKALLHLPCRSLEKGFKIYHDEVQQKRVQLYHCDFSELDSITKLIVCLKSSPIQFMYNCAGSLELKRVENSHGIEKSFCTNYLSHFALTQGIINQQSSPPVIINLAGEFHRFFKLNIHDLQHKKSFNPLRVNSLSMLHRVMWTKALVRHHKSIELKAYSYHPGRIRSGLLNKLPPYISPIIKLINPLFSPPIIGAKTGLWLMEQNSQNLLNGGYYKDCQSINSSKHSYDIGIQDLLWQKSLELLDRAHIKII